MYERLVGSFTTPRGHPVEMAYRADTNDWNTLNASLTQDEYGLRPLLVAGWALDIGGYLGSVAVALAVDNPDLLVDVVEPVPPNVELIRENVQRNGLSDRVTVHDAACAGPGAKSVEVWYGYRGTESLEHHAFVGNSTLAYDDGGEAEHETRIVPALTLTDLVGFHGTIPALVKIDCEGGEWDILRDPIVPGLPLILGEAHAVRGHRGRDIIDILPDHDVTITGDGEGTCEFTAVRR